MRNFKKPSRYSLALKDIINGLGAWHIWILLSWQEIRMRYRRSTLGPFWITLSMGITIYTMGLLYGHLFKTDLAHYYPYLAASMLTWSLLSSFLIEGPSIFVNSEKFLKQIRLPYTTFVFKSTAENFIIFFHNIFVLIPIVIFADVKINLWTCLFVANLGLIWITAVCYSMLLAIFGTRFRDIPQLINSFVQIIFFLTPVMWSPSILPEKYQYLVKLNPFAQYIELLRNPLLGMPPSAYAYASTLTLTTLGLIVTFLIFARYRGRITYWL